MPTKRSAKSLRFLAFAAGLTRSAISPAPDKAARTVPTALVALMALALLGPILLACASTPKPDRLSPQTMSSTPPPESEELPGPDPREPVSGTPTETEAKSVPKLESERDTSSLTVVIEEGTAGRSGKPSLVEAAAAERKRRETASRSIAVVTDKNLGDFKNGQITVMEGAQTKEGRSSEPTGGDAPVEPAPSVPAETDSTVRAEADSANSVASLDPETYWRGRVLRARMNWASAVEETTHLEGKIAELRRRFYAEDDPYYRDSQIKPSWDRALDRLEEVRAAIHQYRREVLTVLEEGRRASALPGWLREGVDLEPDVLEGRPENRPRPPGEYIPGEPKVAADPDGKRP